MAYCFCTHESFMLVVIYFWINTKIALECAQKQFVTAAHTSYFLHDIMEPSVTIKDDLLARTTCLARSIYVLLMASQLTRKVIYNSPDIVFIHRNIHDRLCKKTLFSIPPSHNRLISHSTVACFNMLLGELLLQLPPKRHFWNHNHHNNMMT